jgi:hypothetical protein
MSVIWKFTNPMCLQTKCNQSCVMERRFSSENNDLSLSSLLPEYRS